MGATNPVLPRGSGGQLTSAFSCGGPSSSRALSVTVPPPIATTTPKAATTPTSVLGPLTPKIASAVAAHKTKATAPIVERGRSSRQKRTETRYAPNAIASQVQSISPRGFLLRRRVSHSSARPAIFDDPRSSPSGCLSSAIRCPPGAPADGQPSALCMSPSTFGRSLLRPDAVRANASAGRSSADRRCRSRGTQEPSLHPDGTTHTHSASISRSSNWARLRSYSAAHLTAR